MERAPEHLGGGLVAGLAECAGQRVERGSQLGLRVVLREARIDRLGDISAAAITDDGPLVLTAPA